MFLMLRESKQIRFELSSEAFQLFDAIQSVSLFVSLFMALQRKTQLMRKSYIVGL